MKELAAEKEKENETKRPPWRAVSVSTLSKPDKNALLRAKLLDASRFVHNTSEHENNVPSNC